MGEVRADADVEVDVEVVSGVVEIMRSGWRDRREWRGERGEMVVLVVGRRVTRHGRRRGVGVGWCGVDGADGKVDGTTGIISGIDDIVEAVG
jgi:hypothetical protein